MELNKENLNGIVEEYRDAALKYGECLGKDSKQTNNWFNKIAVAYKILKDADALLALSVLLDDENDAVRLWAGSHLLFVNPQLAEKTLIDLHLNGSFVGFTAKVTLQEWKKGRLNFDY